MAVHCFVCTIVLHSLVKPTQLWILFIACTLTFKFWKGQTSKLLQTYWLTFKNFKSNENVFAFKQLKLDIPLNNGIFRWVLGCFSQLVSPIELKWTYTELICAPPMPNLECNVRFLCKCIIGISLLTYRVFWSASKKASFNDDLLSWLCLPVLSYWQACTTSHIALILENMHCWLKEGKIVNYKV